VPYHLNLQNLIQYHLNEDEIQKIFDLKGLSESLENTRNLFLIGCTTGLRFSDLMKIKEYPLENGMITLTTIKTGQPIMIPIEKRVLDFIPTIKPLANAVFNRNIKDLCKVAEINKILEGYSRNNKRKRVKGFYPKYKLISSHTMRRSFCTNLYGKIPTQVIMKISGHSIESSFLTYIKKPQQHFAEQLKEYYNQKYSTTEAVLK
jgi:integrase